MQTILGHHWHHLSAREAIELLDVDAARGLDTFEITRRQERFGRNVLTRQKSTGPLVLFLLQFNQPLVVILLVAVVITALLHEWVDAGVILGVVLVNAVIGFVEALTVGAYIGNWQTTHCCGFPRHALRGATLSGTEHCYG